MPLEKLIISGGAVLKGTVQISGSKNACLPILAAVVLTPEKCTIRNVPDLADVRTMCGILKWLGVQVKHDRKAVKQIGDFFHDYASSNISSPPAL